MTEQPPEIVPGWDGQDGTQVQVVFSLQEYEDLIRVMAEGMSALPADAVPAVAWQLLNDYLNGGSVEGRDAETGSIESAAILRGL